MVTRPQAVNFFFFFLQIGWEVIEGSLKRASMQLLFPLSPRKSYSWISRTPIILALWLVLINLLESPSEQVEDDVG